MKKVILIFFTSVALSSVFFSASNAVAKERNVISSCRLITTAGMIGRGKCKIKTYIDGNYIKVEVKTPWKDNPTGKTDVMRFVNKPSCNFWSYKNGNGCEGDFWYGSELGWSYVGAGEDKESGRAKFSYSLGTAYRVIYDDSFPRP